MGLSPFSKDRYDEDELKSSNTNCVRINRNPDPNNYKIVKHLQFGKFLLIMINYPDCTNYEGNKILLFDNVSLFELIKQEKIDPHFSNNKKYKSPIARFEPTVYGWILGLKLIDSLI